MGTTLHHLHIFLSSPGDVSRERQLAREVIDRIQSERAYRNRLKLEVVAWDKSGACTRMPAHLEPQEAINRGLKKPSDCDVVIVIFGARMGTPLSDKYRKPDGSRYWSGTEYEFLDGLNATKKTGKTEVLVYRRNQAPSVQLNDPEYDEKKRQWDLVESFFSEFRNPDGSYESYFEAYDEPSDFKDLLDQHLRDFIADYFEKHPLDKAEVSALFEEPSWDPSKAPFPGLRTFTPEEALIFYGRDREIDALIKKLSELSCRLVTVVGASGTGKSSLVAAGMLPALEKDAIPGSKDWICLRFTPAEVGDNPFMALSSAFKLIIEKIGHLPKDMASKLEAYPEGLKEFIAMATDDKPEWAELLLFIDQFDELFTVVDSKYQRPFIDLLEVATKTKRLRIVITMRAEFYPHCLEWPVLDDLLAGGVYTLLAPKTGALHEMITRPAKLAGLRFEEGLVSRILDDTGSEPGSLALMAFALNELWQNSKGAGEVLSHTAYESYNGVHGAIGKRAEDTFNALKREDADWDTALARVFQELVEVVDRGVATRRRARLSHVANGAEAEALVNALTSARLLVTGRGENNVPIVEVAHEAIFTSWPRLRRWIEVKRDDLRLLRQVHLAAAEWDEQGRADYFLWPHERLVFVRKMVERMCPNLSPREEKFIRPEGERLLQAIEDPATTHQQRVKIGDRLAEIGDQRLGVGLRADGLPDISWCKVPAGEITLEKMNETFVVDSFYIGKYPVTWIQYRSFLEAKDGYKNEIWWNEMAEPEDKPGEQYRKLDNHPAENLCWYDAMAFCRWLTNRMGYEIRLPTEREWQQAATGGNSANVYPWGKDWDSSRSNTRESGLSRTTAVGLYPQGTWPEGPLDMSGNVWEWCLNEYGNPKQVALKGKHSRSVRGGCWGYDHVFARCGCRSGGIPGDRDDYLGFRLCCASPIF